MLPIYVLAYPTHLWLLQGFAYLFNKLWIPERSVIIVTSVPELLPKLPDNFGHVKIKNGEWSFMLKDFLDQHAPKYFLFFLEDFWLTRTPDIETINDMYEYMEGTSDILKIDLGADYNTMWHPISYPNVGVHEMIQTVYPARLRMNIQAAVWNRDVLSEFISADENAWKFELNGTIKLNKRPDIKTLGLASSAISYTPIWRCKKMQFWFTETLPDLGYMNRMGFFDEGKRQIKAANIKRGLK